MLRPPLLRMVYQKKPPNLVYCMDFKVCHEPGIISKSFNNEKRKSKIVYNLPISRIQILIFEEEGVKPSVSQDWYFLHRVSGTKTQRRVNYGLKGCLVTVRVRPVEVVVPREI